MIHHDHRMIGFYYFPGISREVCEKGSKRTTDDSGMTLFSYFRDVLPRMEHYTPTSILYTDTFSTWYGIILTISHRAPCKRCRKTCRENHGNQHFDEWYMRYCMTNIHWLDVCWTRHSSILVLSCTLSGTFFEYTCIFPNQ